MYLWFKSQIINSCWTFKFPLHFYWAVNILSLFLFLLSLVSLYKLIKVLGILYSLLSSALKMEVTHSSETFVNFFWTIRHKIPFLLCQYFGVYCTVVQRPLKETLASLMAATLAFCCNLYYQKIGSSKPFDTTPTHFLHNLVTASYHMCFLIRHKMYCS
jgi:hypothetical protein